MAALHSLQSVVTPPPDLQLHVVVYTDDELNEIQRTGSRRLSTASLYRFRSCPQLASMANTSQDSLCSDMAPMTDKDGIIIHTSPMLRNSLYVHVPRAESGGIRSAASTPTPPSTPGSRRRDQMTQFDSKFQTGGGGTSPPSISNLSRTNHICETMVFSMDSQGHLDDWIPLRKENIQRSDERYTKSNGSPMNMPIDDFHSQICDDESASGTDDGSSMHISGRYAVRANRRLYCTYVHGGDDSVDKCSRWLQSLKLNKSDKIKSRSHIQLPPV